MLHFHAMEDIKDSPMAFQFSDIPAIQIETLASLDGDLWEYHLNHKKYWEQSHNHDFLRIHHVRKVRTPTGPTTGTLVTILDEYVTEFEVARLNYASLLDHRVVKSDVTPVDEQIHSLRGQVVSGILFAGPEVVLFPDSSHTLIPLCIRHYASSDPPLQHDWRPWLVSSDIFTLAATDRSVYPYVNNGFIPNPGPGDPNPPNTDPVELPLVYELWNGELNGAGGNEGYGHAKYLQITASFVE